MKNIVKNVLSIALASAFLLSFSACSDSKDSKTIRVGASPAPHAEILENCKDALSAKGYTLEIVEFTDYVQPNLSLDSGDLEANFFQHTPYLEEFCSSNGTDLVSAVKVHFEPLGVYAGKSNDFSNIADGAEIRAADEAVSLRHEDLSGAGDRLR